MKQNLNEYIENAQGGDEAAMEFLIKKFTPKVIAICKEYFLVDAEFDDLLQEGNTGLYKAIKSFSTKKNDNFPLYATLCIRRQLFNAVKKSKAKKNDALNNALSIDEQGRVDVGTNLGDDVQRVLLLGSTLSPEQYSMNKLFMENVTNLIKDLLSVEQYCILIMYINGYSYADIAAKINKNVKFIDNAIQAIRKKLSHIRSQLIKGEQ